MGGTDKLLPQLAARPLGRISWQLYLLFSKQSKDAGWWMWKSCKENLFLLFVNGNGYTVDDKHPKILGLSHWGRKNHFFKADETIIFGKFLSEGSQDGFVNVLGQKKTLSLLLKMQFPIQRYRHLMIWETVFHSDIKLSVEPTLMCVR